MKIRIRRLYILSLIAMICVCGYELRRITGQYQQEALRKEELRSYRQALPEPYDDENEPAPPCDQQNDGEEAEDADNPAQPDTPAGIINQNIIDLQNEINTDVVGWLSIKNTRIDYPFVLAQDNEFYLHRDIGKEQANAGCLFMDYRCARDLSEFNTVIYGHNMKNRSMFGDLRLFADRGFFDANLSGAMLVKDNTYALSIFAYMVVRADDPLIYNPSSDREEFFGYVRKKARQYREPAPEGKVVTLSTCAYEFNGARMVLLATLHPALCPAQTKSLR